MSADNAKLWCGHAGFSADAWRKGVFFPNGLKKDQEFYHYANRYPTAEMNTSFYGIPRESTVAKWAAQAKGRGFRYAIKVPKAITHEGRLEPDTHETLRFLWTRLQPLRDAGALGPLLFQLPPSLPRSIANLSAMAAAVAALDGDVQAAFEFRHPSWWTPEVHDVLRAHNFASVVVSHPELPWDATVTADFVYVRFHGIRALHADTYTADELAAFATTFKEWLAAGRTVYAYFQYDGGAAGLTNAADLIERVTGEKPKPAVPAAGTLHSFFGAPKPKRKAPPPDAPPSPKRSKLLAEGEPQGEPQQPPVVAQPAAAETDAVVID